MIKSKSLAGLILFAFMIVPDASGREVILNAVSGGIYENGVFSQNGNKYKAECVINKVQGTIVVGKVIVSDREGRQDEGASYEIINSLESSGFSELMVSREKKGQEIFTGVRDVAVGTTEILIVGKDFYEYCRAANGKFYLESGEVTEKIL